MREETLFSDRAGKVYLRLIRRLLSRYRRRGWYEDLLSFVVLEVCRQLATHAPAAREAAGGLVAAATRQAVWQWMRSPENPERTENSKHNPTVRWVSYEQEVRAHPILRDWEGRTVEPDFAPALIHRLWSEEVWTEALAVLTESEREPVLRLCLEPEEGWRERSAALGLPRATAHGRCVKGLERLRKYRDGMAKAGLSE